ncbi:protein of unknown function [Methylococcus capsulatus]|uniref:Uncharacterized protein n=1 Tax=Methylococcus capsulatus TaxID=414 RepID=A0AA35XYR7_METCP|nr:protein of unknown function [Methylococcus capsulatus]
MIWSWVTSGHKNRTGRQFTDAAEHRTSYETVARNPGAYASGGSSRGEHHAHPKKTASITPPPAESVDEAGAREHTTSGNEQRLSKKTF